MKDIVPELLEAIQKDFAASVSTNPAMIRFAELVKSGTATYKQANDYATWCGQFLSMAYEKNITSGILPDGKMYYNIADRILSETLTQNHELIAAAAEAVQTSLNKNADIGIKAIKPKLNKDRIRGLVEKISTADNFVDVAWVLAEPVVNFSRSVVDDAIKANVEFHGKSGLSAKIVRTPEAGACKWCRDIAGTYAYPDVPEDVYRRHDRCGCVVDYQPSNGKRKTVHSGTEGMRRYIKDEYGNYVLQKTRRLV